MPATRVVSSRFRFCVRDGFPHDIARGHSYSVGKCPSYKCADIVLQVQILFVQFTVPLLMTETLTFELSYCRRPIPCLSWQWTTARRQVPARSGATVSDRRLRTGLIVVQYT